MEGTCAAIDIKICEEIDDKIKRRTMLGTKSKNKTNNENATEPAYYANQNSVICKIEQDEKIIIWNKTIIYEDYHIFYNINEIIYITTTANGHTMPRVVKCIVTGISIPMVAKGKKIQPIYHIVSTGKDKDYSTYNTNIKYEASKNKVFCGLKINMKFMIRLCWNN